jgi:hypothetical protein
MNLPPQCIGMNRTGTLRSVPSGDRQVAPSGALSWLYDHIVKPGLRIGCKAGCATAGTLLAGGCTVGSEGVAVIECAAAGAALAQACSAGCDLG